MASERLAKIQAEANGQQSTATTKNTVVIPVGLDTSSLRHLAIAYVAGTNELRNGFTLLEDGRAVSTKQLKKLIENHQ